MNYFQFKKVGFLTPTIQIILLIVLFILTALVVNYSYQETGLIFGITALTIMAPLFAPIYEEVLFRGLMMPAFMKRTTVKKAIIFTSLIFGIWHMKNIFFYDTGNLVTQILYAGLIFGPLMGYLTYKTKSIWISSIIHYINNLVIFILFVGGVEWGMDLVNTLLK